jgi:hypothetical protein
MPVGSWRLHPVLAHNIYKRDETLAMNSFRSAGQHHAHVVVRGLQIIDGRSGAVMEYVDMISVTEPWMADIGPARTWILCRVVAGWRGRKSNAMLYMEGARRQITTHVGPLLAVALRSCIHNKQFQEK